MGPCPLPQSCFLTLKLTSSLRHYRLSALCGIPPEFLYPAALCPAIHPSCLPFSTQRQAARPRDYRPYPEARVTVRSPVELIKIRPFFGEWLEIERNFPEEHSRLEDDGSYIYGASTGISVSGAGPPDVELKMEYTIFARLGRTMEFLDSDEEQPEPTVVSWRQASLTPAWQRNMEADQSQE